VGRTVTQLATPGFPWAKFYFDERFPMIMNYPLIKVRDAFSKYSTLIDENLAGAFKPGLEPSVKISDQYKNLYGFTPPIGDEIYISLTFVRELEKVLADYGPPKRRSRHSPTELEEKALKVLEATVLHEMVHYFRRRFVDQARVNLMSARGRGNEEAVARQFEREAYGVYCTVENLGIGKYFPNTMRIVEKP
jgi:hypothetical protein